MDSKALQYVKKLGPLIGLILLFVIISVMNDSFLEFSNLRNLLRQVSINAIIAFGMTFVILTGGIDLSVGSILALSSAVMANLIVTGTDPVLAIVLAAGAGPVSYTHLFINLAHSRCKSALKRLLCVEFISLIIQLL